MLVGPESSTADIRIQVYNWKLITEQLAHHKYIESEYNAATPNNLTARSAARVYPLGIFQRSTYSHHSVPFIL